MAPLNSAGMKARLDGHGHVRHELELLDLPDRHELEFLDFLPDRHELKPSACLQHEIQEW
jgi:hypothetical protein